MSNDIVEVPQRATQIAMTIDPEHATLVPQNLGEVVAFANLMARSGPAVPKHLRDHPGACLAVAMRAFHLGAEPFALADKTYFVNDRMALEAQAIAAIILTRVQRKGMPKYNYEGEGPTLRCEVLITMPDGEVVPWKSPKLADIRPQNSPLWKSDPEQQIGYYSIRGWARRHRPDVIMGIYDREEAAAIENDDRATSFEALEQRAETVVEVREVVEPKPAKKAADKPKEDKKADPQTATAEPAGRSPTTESAPASETTGSQTTSGASQDQAEAERPTTTEPAQTADGAQASSGSPTSASTDSQEGTSSQEQLGDQSSDGEKAQGDLLATQSGGTGEDFPGDRKAAEPDQALDRQSVDQASERPSGGFVDYADAIAAADDWPSIDLAKADLRKTEEWKAATYDMQEVAHRIAYVRLREIVDAGYQFDFIMDLQAYRSYCSWEEDLEALKGNRAAVANTPMYRAANTPTKIALDKVYDNRVAAIKAAKAAAEFS